MRNVDFVLYTSKLCNLRCSYCYELPLLGDRARMSPPQLDRLFTHVREHLDGPGGGGEPVSVRFQWHGGEPLLIEPAYYWAAFASAERVFAGSAHRVQHTVQTNLTVLDDARIDLLENGFSAVGVSLDLCSGLRVNQRGVDQEHRTIANLDKVLAAGIKPDGISVLSRPMLGQLPVLYSFYKSRRMAFRVLPLEKGLYRPGQSFEITSAEILAALVELADLWFADDEAVPVEPIVEHVRLLVSARAWPDSRLLHDKRVWEPVLSVDTDGRLLGYTSYFDDAHALGNVFDTPLSAILGGPAHEAATVAAEARVRATCTGCEFFGRGCTSWAIAESEVSILDSRSDGAVECSVTQPLLRHIEQRLIETGVFERSGGLTPAMREAQRQESARSEMAS